MIRSRKLKYFGHIVRHESIMKLLLQCTTPGKRMRGRQRRKWIDNIKEWTGKPMWENTIRAADRVGWRSIVDHLWNRDVT